MAQQPEQLKTKALKELADITSISQLELWRVGYLGRKGELTMILRGLGSLPAEERKVVGARANEIKVALEDGWKQKEQALHEAELALAKREAIDITLPGRPFPIGHLHPITQTLNEMCDIFILMGFQVVEGPAVEWDS